MGKYFFSEIYFFLKKSFSIEKFNAAATFFNRRQSEENGSHLAKKKHKKLKSMNFIEQFRLSFCK